MFGRGSIGAYTLAFLVSTAMPCSQVANARKPDSFIADPYYLTSGTFVLDPQLYPGTQEYRIATFLPHHSLIFREKAPITQTIGGIEYTTAITQHGERYLIPDKLI